MVSSIGSADSATARPVPKGIPVDSTSSFPERLSGLLQGFNVNRFVAALIGSLIYSLLGLVIEAALGGLFSKR